MTTPKRARCEEEDLMGKGLDDAARYNAADEAHTAQLLRDKADEHEKKGDHRQEAVYRNAAAKADDRADVWRGLLR